MNIIDPVDRIVRRRDVTNRYLLYADYCFVANQFLAPLVAIVDRICVKNGSFFWRDCFLN